MNTISPSASQREPATGVRVGSSSAPLGDVSERGQSPDYSAWRKPALVAELKRLNHRKTFQIVSATVRKKEDAEIDAIIAELRRRETK